MSASDKSSNPSTEADEVMRKPIVVPTEVEPDKEDGDRSPTDEENKRDVPGSDTDKETDSDEVIRKPIVLPTEVDTDGEDGDRSPTDEENKRDVPTGSLSDND